MMQRVVAIVHVCERAWAEPAFAAGVPDGRCSRRRRVALQPMMLMRRL